MGIKKNKNDLLNDMEQSLINLEWMHTANPSSELRDTIDALMESYKEIKENFYNLDEIIEEIESGTKSINKGI